MQEETQREIRDPGDDFLPPVGNRREWLNVSVILAILVVINVVAFLVSFGGGLMVTLPLTLFMGFLLLRNAVPRHRLPPGRTRPAG